MKLRIWRVFALLRLLQSTPSVGRRVVSDEERREKGEKKEVSEKKFKKEAAEIRKE